MQFARLQRRGPDDTVRAALSVVIALGVAIGLGLAWWSAAPTQLSGPINIVGHPTFADFVYTRSFLGYRLIVWEFPIVSALVFALLRWRGPLRAPRPSSRARVALAEPVAVDADTTRPSLTRWVQVLPPAVLVAGAVSARSVTVGATFARAGLVAGAAYIVIVIVIALVAMPWLARRGLVGRRLVVGGAALPLTNAIGSILISVGALVFVSRHTLVMTQSQQVTYWQWFPLWLAASAIVGVLAWMAWRLRSGWSVEVVERRIRTVVVGSTAIFLLTAAIPGAIARVQGFDDTQSVTGADLMTRGYFPWRDFMVIHGVFEDALRTLIGFGIFQHTVWGGLAGTTIIVAPLCWVGYYALAVWAGRWRSIVVLSLFALAAWGQLPIAWRFVAIPFIFVLLGEALRRPKSIWVVWFTAALFIEAVLVPEASFQVVATAATIVAADLVHRDAEASWWVALRRTRWFLGTSAVLGTVLAGYLVANGALGQFIAYFRIFGPGHDAAGAIPRTHVTTTQLAMYVVGIVLVILTIWMATWRLVGRRTWSSRDWVTVSAAMLTGLYGEKALGRFDYVHVLQVATVAVPLWVLWATTLFGAADDFVSAQLRRLPPFKRPRIVVRQPVTLVAVLALAVLVPGAVRDVWHAPGRTKSEIGSLVQTPLVGYALPRAVDRGLLADLRTALTTYAGPNGRIFDNTNSLGYFYYLLQRAPASTFIHVSMVQPEFAQRQLIGQLTKSRPPVVVFDERLGIGLAEWDGPRNNVRHFEVAQYLLDGWTPVLSTHSVVLMLRNDLLATMPAVPRLTTPPVTTDLHFAVPSCDWGDSADFLTSHPTGPTVSLPVTAQGVASSLDIRGWAFDPGARAAPSRIVITIGGIVVSDLPPSVGRPDVAAIFKDPAATVSGYDVSITTVDQGTPVVYALQADGALHLVGNTRTTPPTVQMPDGTRLPVTTRAFGAVDDDLRRQVRLSTITVPGSVDLAAYPLATFSAPTRIGEASIALTDAALTTSPASAIPTTAANTHEITAGVLPLTGSSLSVRVGSCLQWHGYTSHTLSLVQVGGTPITSVVLSRVRD